MDGYHREVYNIVSDTLLKSTVKVCVCYSGGSRGQGLLVIQHSLFISVSFCRVRPSEAFIAMRQLQHKAGAYSY